VDAGIRRSCLTLALAVSFASVVTAKGPTVKVSISGPGLGATREVSDADALASIWSDTGFLAGLGLGTAKPFIGMRTAAPDARLPRYTVAFWVKEHGSQQVSLDFVVTYVYDPRAHAGYVYLPGPKDAAYNHQVITRFGEDGRWHRATSRWSDAIISSVLSGLK
jgi:hypothetical protein